MTLTRKITRRPELAPRQAVIRVVPCEATAGNLVKSFPLEPVREVADDFFETGKYRRSLHHGSLQAPRTRNRSTTVPRPAFVAACMGVRSSSADRACGLAP